MSSAAPVAPPRQRLTVSPSFERRRAFIDKAFRVAGFLATFFGLGMLVLFLVRLGMDTVSWFQVMPGLVHERNQEIKDRVANAEQNLKDAKAALVKELQTELAGAANEQEKKEIQEFFEKEVMPRKLETLRAQAKDYENDLQFIREDTSPAAMTWHFLTSGPTNVAQDAGIRPALLGSIWLVLITGLLAVPIGVGAAIYLEEYKSTYLASFLEFYWHELPGYRLWGAWLIGALRRLPYFIQLNINNLAGVPSVVFGILGAALFVEMMFHPIEVRQYELLNMGEPVASGLRGLYDRFVMLLPAVASRNVTGGAMTLALLTLPIIIVASQEAIRAVPQSIRHGAYALGATHWQVTWTVVLPNAIPGILTGTILSMSRAIGEAAPLVLFGALLFVSQDPDLFSRFTVMPMQIFGWADRPYLEWRYNAAFASVFLLLTLLIMNGIAIYLRQRGQRHMKW